MFDWLWRQTDRRNRCWWCSWSTRLGLLSLSLSLHSVCVQLQSCFLSRVPWLRINLVTRRKEIDSRIESTRAHCYSRVGIGNSQGSQECMDFWDDMLIKKTCRQDELRASKGARQLWVEVEVSIVTHCPIYCSYTEHPPFFSSLGLQTVNLFYF